MSRENKSLTLNLYILPHIFMYKISLHATADQITPISKCNFSRQENFLCRTIRPQGVLVKELLVISYVFLPPRSNTRIAQQLCQLDLYNAIQILIIIIYLCSFRPRDQIIVRMQIQGEFLVNWFYNLTLRRTLIRHMFRRSVS